jgi:hypothetical protein
LPLTIRPPTIDELSGLSDLCFRSKAVWGYDDEFMEAYRGRPSAVSLGAGKDVAETGNEPFAVAD